MLVLLLQEEDFIARDSFEDTDQLRVGNDGIFMLTFFSKSAQFFGMMVWVRVIYCVR